MKKIIFFLIVGLSSTKFYAQNSSSDRPLIPEIIGANQTTCGIHILKPEKVVSFSIGTLEDLLIRVEASVPGFRANLTGTFNQPPLLTYRNCIINDVYVDGVRYDASILQYISPNNIQSIQVFNSVMESDIYSSNSKNIKS